MDQPETFPCPGCGAPLIVGSGQAAPEVAFAAPLDPALAAQILELAPDPVDFRTEADFLAAEKAYDSGARPQRRTVHYPFGSDCNMRALVAAVRSLDAGQRDRAQIETETAAKRDRLINDLAGRIRDYMDHLGFTAPTREDHRDRALCPYCGTTDHLEASPAGELCRAAALRGDPDHPGVDNPLIGNRCTHGVRLDEPCAKCDAATTHCPPPCGARHDQPPAAHHATCPRSGYVAGTDPARVGDCTHGFIGTCPHGCDNLPPMRPDVDPVYGPCGVCKGDHVTEDHEAAPGGAV